MYDRNSAVTGTSIRRVNRGLAAAAIWLLVAVALPSSAAADCCVCTDCATVAASCSFVDGCDFGECESRCLNAGCETNVLFIGESCSSIPECREVLPAPAGGPAVYVALGLLLVTLGAFGVRRRSLPMPVRAASLLLVVLASATAVSALTQIRLTGRWQLDSNALSTDPVAQVSWKAHVAVGKDGALSGTVELEGFAGADMASVHGTLAGGVVSGTLRNGGGATIAEFQGTAENGSLQGTFSRSDNGETGTFSWEISDS